MRLLYIKPKLKDMSQGARISFVRQFKTMSQDEISDKLGLNGECKRRTLARYERGDRNPKKSRTKEIAEILEVNYNSIKKYDFRDNTDICYFLMWLEELIPHYRIDLSNIPKVNEEYIIKFKNFIREWEEMRNQRQKRLISYYDYINWKLNYNMEVNNNEN